ncbi:MAG: hypothetical protein PHW47_07110 [Lachnospira sp.]|nr:hypothetical protein [Lachnospira sp.]
MSTDIRPEISKKSKYWISKHRYYELKHFCMQYPEWKKIYSSLEDKTLPGICIDCVTKRSGISNPTQEIGIEMEEYSRKIEMIEDTAYHTDPTLCGFIIKAVTESTSFTELEMMMDIPCSRDTFYDRYRKFFWMLNSVRG